jgi:hypothetical protein
LFLVCWFIPLCGVLGVLVHPSLWWWWWCLGVVEWERVVFVLLLLIVENGSTCITFRKKADRRKHNEYRERATHDEKRANEMDDRAMEIEALSAIFMDDIEVEDGNAGFSLRLVPFPGDDENNNGRFFLVRPSICCVSCVFGREHEREEMLSHACMCIPVC